MNATDLFRRPARPPRLSVALFWAAFAAAAVTLLHGPVSFSASAGRDVPRVVASIKPLHSLAALIMAGVGEPKLLISGADSPHTHALRPSEAQALHDADVLFWVGPTLETSFAGPIAALVQGKAVSLLSEPGVTVYPVRPAGGLPQDDAARERESKAPGASDPHIWLDPANARAVARIVAAALESADPAHAATYAANAAALDEKLAALDAELGEKLAPLRGMPFIVYHDAYQYLERRYGLNPIASVTLSPEQAPGARRIRALRELISERRVACIFTEPEFEPAIVRTIAEGTGAKIATLDPEGASLAPGPEFYFTLMRRIAGDLRGCLIASGG